MKKRRKNKQCYIYTKKTNTGADERKRSVWQVKGWGRKRDCVDDKVRGEVKGREGGERGERGRGKRQG